MPSKVSHFDVWWKQHPEVHKYVKPIPCTKKWVTLKCECTQYIDVDAHGKFDIKGKTQTVAYDAIMCIDPKSKYVGNIYNCDSYLELQFKFTGLAVTVRPAQVVGTMGYHLLGVGVVRAVIDGIKKHQTIREIAKKAFQAIAKIFKAPFYCSLLLGAAVVAAVGGVCYRPLLYDCRAVTGRIITELYGRTEWSLSPCMYRLVNITFFEKKAQKLEKAIKYEDPTNPVLVGIANLANKAPI